ncbi:lipoprotein, putative [Burkholderia pseudomallei 1710b]|uniref:Lipoprotein, putative n=1 Tax=Burkholderia pseudomallei (strain 1710b) TaxID=320372 RepID=Q3JLK9_BURP1|nr:lipoprotein, putative [Burkholderia pseudomallei 1710b]
MQRPVVPTGALAGACAKLLIEKHRPAASAETMAIVFISTPDYSGWARAGGASARARVTTRAALTQSLRQYRH